MDWSNDVVMEFIHLYESEPLIWDPKDERHKDRQLVHEAWKRIQSDLSVQCSLNELKHKKNNLMATYRKLAMKVVKKNVYRPKWFAFEKMASFLHTIYTPMAGKIYEIPENELAYNSLQVNLLENEYSIPHTEAGPSASPSPCSASEAGARDADPTLSSHDATPSNKKRKVRKSSRDERRIVEAYRFLKTVAAKPKANADECELFSTLLASKLRALDEDSREEAMHEIDNIMFRIRKCKKLQNHTL